MKIKLSSRVALLLIAAMFILPLIVARLMVTGTIDYKPGSFRNLGELVKPPVAVDWKNHPFSIPPDFDLPVDAAQLPFRGHWVVLHLVPATCISSCTEAVANLRQVHKALGREQTRVQIALLLSGAMPTESIEELRSIYPQFQLLENPDGTIQHILDEIAREFSAPAAGSSYLIDPIGNIMMYYPTGADPNNLKKDLKRLLTWSKLDK